MIWIETAGLGDGERLARLHAACFAQSWSADFIDGLVKTRECVALLARAHEEDVGFILARVAADEAEILSIGVIDTARRRGIATKLLRVASLAASAKGAVNLFLEVAADNRAASALYGRLGFRQVGRRPRYYGETGADGLVLCAPLPLGNAAELD